MKPDDPRSCAELFPPLFNLRHCMGYTPERIWLGAGGAQRHSDAV